jgi:hypothetical protein
MRKKSATGGAGRERIFHEHRLLMGFVEWKEAS